MTGGTRARARGRDDGIPRAAGSEGQSRIARERPLVAMLVCRCNSPWPWAIGHWPLTRGPRGTLKPLLVGRWGIFACAAWRESRVSRPECGVRTPPTGACEISPGLRGNMRKRNDAAKHHAKGRENGARGRDMGTWGQRDGVGDDWEDRRFGGLVVDYDVTGRWLYRIGWDRRGNAQRWK